MFPVILLFLIFLFLSSSSANELTVGKVYAALMIFDYYKQNRTRRIQLQQQSASGSQVLCPQSTCLHTSHRHALEHTKSGCNFAKLEARALRHYACIHWYTLLLYACTILRKEGTFVSTSQWLVDNRSLYQPHYDWKPADLTALTARTPATAKGEPVFGCWLGLFAT